jgi:hypothetical protein
MPGHQLAEKRAESYTQSCKPPAPRDQSELLPYAVAMPGKKDANLRKPKNIKQCPICLGF